MEAPWVTWTLGRSPDLPATARHLLRVDVGTEPRGWCLVSSRRHARARPLSPCGPGASPAPRVRKSMVVLPVVGFVLRLAIPRSDSRTRLSAGDRPRL